LTTIIPSRVAEPSFAATRNDTVAVPCPDAGENAVIQVTLLATSHAHSGCVVMASDPDPPADSIVPGAARDT
jgi:hypothetical protein